MAKYVDVEPLIEEYTKSINYVTTHATKMNIMEFANAGACFETARQTLMDAPAADVTPAVRCGDCKWWEKQESSCQGRCALFGIYPTASWFCANGAKEDNDEEVR